MKTIGKYQVLDSIGSGGFAVVYKGFDPDIKRLVAIKVCASNDENVRARFYHEAEIAGRLSHRNITAVYEFGVFLQTPYLVEEYLPGADLAQLIRRREPSFLAEKIDILLQVTSGLAYAHRQGVVHRDVKPANVRVLDDGSVKILDFGTAKVIGSETGLTQTGMTLGTVAYMAPERLCGEPGQASADIFSLGALAFELFTFSRPFDAVSIPQVIEQVLEKAAPPIRDRWSDCPAAFAAVVDRALAHDANDRYPTAVELLADLEAFRDAWLAKQKPAARPAPASEVPGLLARIESLLAAGRTDRARLLLEEALEIAPADDQVRRLATDHGLVKAPASVAPSAPATDRPQATLEPAVIVPAAAEVEGPEPGGRQAVVARSILALVSQGRLVEAARSLAFAQQLFDDLGAMPALARAIVDGLRQSVVTLRHEALREAHRVSMALRNLDLDAELDPDLASHLAERAEDLAPGRTSALEIAEQCQRRARARGGAGRGGDAVASIEHLLDAGEIDQAAEALRFALDMIGPFAGSERLARRIDHARRSR